VPVADLPGEEAYRNLRSGKALWPDERAGDQRLSELVRLGLKPSFGFSRDDRIMTLGSCFARGLEERLNRLGFMVPMRRPVVAGGTKIDQDLVIKFTVQSIENELRWASGQPPPAPEALFLEVADGLWHDAQLVQSAPMLPLDEALARRRQIQAAVGRFPDCRVVIVTLGLAEAWFDEASGLYLNTAPPMSAVRRHPGRFRLHILSYDDILASLERIHDLLRDKGHPDVKMLVTVSPVPFKATFSGEDVIVANSYSKSVQRAACQAFVQGREGVDYFPSYEIVAMSAREQAYEIDNLHVAPAMVRHIMDEVLAAYAPGVFTPPTRAEIPESRIGRPLGEHFDGVVKAKSLIEVGRFAEAVQVCQQTLDRYADAMPAQDLSAARQVYASALRRQGLWPEATRQLELAAALDHRGGEVFYKLGQCHEKLGRFDDAVAAFSRAVEIDSARPEFGLGLQRVQALAAASAEARGQEGPGAGFRPGGHGDLDQHRRGGRQGLFQRLSKLGGR